MGSGRAGLSDWSEQGVGQYATSAVREALAMFARYSCVGTRPYEAVQPDSRRMELAL